MARKKKASYMDKQAAALDNAAKEASRGIDGERGREIRNMTFGDTPRVAYRPMDIDAHNAAMQAAADAAEAQWHKENPSMKMTMNNMTDGLYDNNARLAGVNAQAAVAPEGYPSWRFANASRYDNLKDRSFAGSMKNYNYKGEPRAWFDMKPSATYNQPTGANFNFSRPELGYGGAYMNAAGDIEYSLGPVASKPEHWTKQGYVPNKVEANGFDFFRKDYNKYPSPYPFDYRITPFDKSATSPAEMQAGLNPNFEKVSMPESVSRHALYDTYKKDFLNRASSNSNGRISMSDVGELMETYPELFKTDPMQGPQAFTARYNNGVPIKDAIYSDAALEWADNDFRRPNMQGPFERDIAIDNRMIANEERKMLPLTEGEAPLQAQNFDQKGKPTGKGIPVRKGVPANLIQAEAGQIDDVVHRDGSGRVKILGNEIPAPTKEELQSMVPNKLAHRDFYPNDNGTPAHKRNDYQTAKTQFEALQDEVSKPRQSKKVEYKDAAIEGYSKGGQAGAKNLNKGLWNKGMRYANGVAAPAMIAGQAAKTMWDARSGAPTAVLVGATGTALAGLASMGMDGMMVVDGLSKMASDAKSAYQYINSGALGRDIANLPERIKIALAEAAQERAEQAYVYDDNPNNP